MCVQFVSLVLFFPAMTFRNDDNLMASVCAGIELYIHVQDFWLLFYGKLNSQNVKRLFSSCNAMFEVFAVTAAETGTPKNER